MTNSLIENLITIDETGLPKLPNIKQILDKDIFLLYTRDNTPDKSKYLKECGVIYYLGDPKSPARQQGLNDKESLKEAIDNFDLPKNYIPDSLVLKIINKYKNISIGPAGLAIENLLRALHNASIIANKANDILTEKLTEGVVDQDIPTIVSTLNMITDQIKNIPKLQEALFIAKENLIREEEEKVARGGVKIISSMNADDN